MIDEQNVALHTEKERDSDIHYSWKIKLTSHKYCVLFLTNKLKFERQKIECLLSGTEMRE